MFSRVSTQANANADADAAMPDYVHHLETQIGVVFHTADDPLHQSALRLRVLSNVILFHDVVFVNYAEEHLVERCLTDRVVLEAKFILVSLQLCK